ncbi:hypothetical protein Efla_005181 [Eimeria flavescens]
MRPKDPFARALKATREPRDSYSFLICRCLFRDSFFVKGVVMEVLEGSRNVHNSQCFDIVVAKNYVRSQLCLHVFWPAVHHKGLLLVRGAVNDGCYNLTMMTLRLQSHAGVNVQEFGRCAPSANSGRTHSWLKLRPSSGEAQGDQVNLFLSVCSSCPSATALTTHSELLGFWIPCLDGGARQPTFGDGLAEDLLHDAFGQPEGYPQGVARVAAVVYQASLVRVAMRVQLPLGLSYPRPKVPHFAGYAHKAEQGSKRSNHWCSELKDAFAPCQLMNERLDGKI